MKPASPRLCEWLGLSVAICLALLAPTTGCRAADPTKFPPSVAAPHQPTHTIYVTANHWHAGLILADDDLPPTLHAALQPWRDELARRGEAPATHHEFGWGDDAYYKAPAGTKDARMTLAAMLWPTRSVNHLWSLDAPPPVFFTDWNVALFRIELSPAGYAAMCAELLDHFTVPAVVEQPGVYGPRSAFLTANPKRKYTILHNCNHMTADALRAAGLPIRPIYAVHSVNVEHQLDRAAKRYDAVRRLKSRTTH